ncbi:MAG TPA: chemotaxis protein CheW [Anaeromyxobacteraceae bacterium]|nr:chemotaxis protein CheW [Anaeromyxobacteraceae bacterium]
MDFLRIRQKAKERAEARPGPPVREEGEASPPEPAPPAPSPDRIEDALREELASLASTSTAALAQDPLDEFFWREDEVAAGLPAILAAAPVRPAEVEEARSEWLTFLLAGEEYAVAIENLREILKAPAITEVPRAPPHVLGVIMVRGEVISVFDPRRRLGLPGAAPTRQSRVLVCDAGSGRRGLLVDAVSQVVRLTPSQVEPRPTGIGGASAEFIDGIGRDNDRMFILLDLAEVLRDGAPLYPAEAP